MESVLDIAKERMRHPFLGSFSIGFIMWNWKAFIYATTGSAEASERIDKILSVTIGIGENRQWFFLYEPLIFAFVVAIVILPLGTSVLELWQHFVLVKEQNIKDQISAKWNESDDLILKKSQDLGGYSRHLVSIVLDDLNKNKGQGLDPRLQKAMQFLEPIQKQDAAMIKKAWDDLPKEYKSQ